MCGGVSCEIVFASRSKRSLSCALSANEGGRILMATMRSRRVSRALYTSPIPPAPMSAPISYGPRRLPVVIAMEVGMIAQAVPGARCSRQTDGWKVVVYGTLAGFAGDRDAALTPV